VFEIVDGNRARELAPGLSERIVRGVYYSHGMHTINPYKVVTDTGRALHRRRRHPAARPRALASAATAIA
jgi:glycine/D-amino acid oxidase-like deaminating enzyme